MKEKFTRIDILITIIMIIVIFLTIYPIYYIFINSFSGGSAVASGSVLLYPKDITFAAYRSVLKDPNIARSYINSILYTFFGTVLSVILTSMCAYPLSRKELFGRNKLMAFFMFTMFFSGGIIPLFLVILNINIYNTVWAILLPSVISVYNVIVMRSFFQSIPYELTESAYLDGANDIVIFSKIILPLSTPIIATMTLFYGVGNWNSFYNALMFVSDKKLYPVQLILRSIVIDGATGELSFAIGSDTSSNAVVDTKSIRYAVIAVTTIPVMLVYPFVFKYFQKGVMIGSVKG